jgi:hypothetical protein
MTNVITNVITFLYYILAIDLGSIGKLLYREIGAWHIFQCSVMPFATSPKSDFQYCFLQVVKP